MALTVNIACGHQSFVDVRLPALDPYPYSVVPCARKPLLAEMSSLEAVLQLLSFASVSVPISASNGNADIAAPVSYVHLNQPSGSQER